MMEESLWIIITMALVLIIFAFLLLFTGMIQLPKVVPAPILIKSLKKKGTIPYNIVWAIVIGIVGGIALFALWSVFAPGIAKAASSLLHGIFA